MTPKQRLGQRDVPLILKQIPANLDYSYLTEWAEQLGLVYALSLAFTKFGV